MNNHVVLEKLQRAEALVIEALRLMYEIKEEVEIADNPPHIKRQDRKNCEELCYTLFKLVEPNHLKDGPETITIELANNTSLAPRGLLGGFRLRYEVLCGVRCWLSGWEYPKV